MVTSNQQRGAVHHPKGLAGPTIRLTDQRMPCGCRLDRDEDRKLRIYYCAPHAFAYETLDALQEATKVVDQIVAAAPADWDVTHAMEVGMKARRVLKKVKDSEARG